MAELRNRQLLKSKSSVIVGEEEDLRFKIVLLGDSGVGKTCLMKRYFSQEAFAETPKTTIGMDIFSDLCVIDGNLIKVYFWDTAGQERYHTALRESYFRSIDAIVVVYDITDVDSFKHVEGWIKEAKNYSSKDNFVCMLLGNKCDLENHRKVSKKEAEKLLQCHPEIYWVFETSAMESTNTERAFVTLVSELARKYEGVDKARKRRQLDIVRLMDDGDITRRYMIRTGRYDTNRNCRGKSVGCGCS